MENQEKEIFMGVVEDADLKLTAKEVLLEQYESRQIELINLGQETQSPERDEKIMKLETELTALADELGIEETA